MIRRPHNRKPEIDLDGPQGNAFFLLGTAASYSKQLGWLRSYIEVVLADMRSSDYEHLITVFDKHFGEYVDLVRCSKDN